MKLQTLSLLALLLCTSVPAGAAKKQTYTNPVINVSAPDPTVLRDNDGTYWLYATENTRNVPIYRSDDLVDWKLVGTAFTTDDCPAKISVFCV